MECRGLEDNKTCPLYKHANSKLGRQHTMAPTTAQLFERLLVLTHGYILTRVSFSFYQKHSLGKFSLFFLEYPIIKL